MLTRIQPSDAIRPVLRKLRDTVQLTVHYGVLDKNRVVYVDKIESQKTIRMASYVGLSVPVYCTSLGKAILAYMPDSEAKEIIASCSFEPRTANTITSPDRFLEELKVVREIGYALDNVENEEGIRCVGAPVFGANGRVVAAVSVSGPVFEVSKDDVPRLGELLRNAARSISQRLGYFEHQEQSI